MGLCIEKPTKKEQQQSEQSGQEIPNKDSEAEGNQNQDQDIKNPEPSVLDTVNTSQKDKIQNNYTLLSPPLGQGAFGEVRKAIHKLTGLTRAVKIIQKSNVPPEEINRVLNEVEILKKLDHPFIIKIFELYQDDKNIYIVTEYCQGGELFDAIMNFKSFSEKDAALILQQILSAIYYCHSHKIIHRDIKPENILLDSINEQELSIKIIDFGTSRTFDPTKKLNIRIGTPYYIAPEVLKKKYDEKCDIWSCGVILYILLCGYPPFNGKSDAKILEEVSKGVFDFESDEWDIISEECKDFIRKLLIIDPNQRYSAQQALEDPWFKMFQDKQGEDLPQVSKALNNMRSFKNSQKLSQAVYLYIVNQFTTSEEKRELLKTFQSLDLNKDGLLSSEELLIGLKKIMEEEEAEKEVKRIMSAIDTNNSGKIDYSEFVAATVNRQKLLSVERLNTVFQQIDKDRNGTIEIAELKQFFGNGQIPDEVWKQLIVEVDENSDGTISYQEFQAMMLKLTV